MLAKEVVFDDQVPPGVVLARVVVYPTFSSDAPVIAATVGEFPTTMLLVTAEFPQELVTV